MPGATIIGPFVSRSRRRWRTEFLMRSISPVPYTRVFFVSGRRLDVEVVFPEFRLVVVAFSWRRSCQLPLRMLLEKSDQPAGGENGLDLARQGRHAARDAAGRDRDA